MAESAETSPRVSQGDIQNKPAIATPTKPIRTHGFLISLSSYWLGFNNLWTVILLFLLPAQVLEIVGNESKGTSLGLTTLFGAVVSMIIEPISGLMSDKTSYFSWGRRRPYVVFGVIMCCFFLIMLGASKTLPNLIGAYILVEFFGNFAMAPYCALTPDLVDDTQVGLCSGYMGLSNVFGILVAGGLGLITNSISSMEMYGILIGIQLISLFFTCIGIKEDNPKLENEALNVMKRETQSVTDSPAPPVPPGLEDSISVTEPESALTEISLDIDLNSALPHEINPEIQRSPSSDPIPTVTITPAPASASASGSPPHSPIAPPPTMSLRPVALVPSPMRASMDAANHDQLKPPPRHRKVPSDLKSLLGWVTGENQNNNANTNNQSNSNSPAPIEIVQNDQPNTQSESEPPPRKTKKSRNPIMTLFRGIVWAVNIFLEPLRASMEFRMVVLSQFFCLMAVSTVQSFLQYFFDDVVTKPYTLAGTQIAADAPGAVSVFLVCLLIGAIFSTVTSGALSDKIGRKPLLMLAIAAMIIVSAVFLVVTDFEAIVGMGFIFGLGFGMFQSLNWALATDNLPDSGSRARDMGVWHISIVLPQVIATPIAGALLDHFQTYGDNLGYKIIWSLAIVYAFIGFLFLTRVKSR